MAAVGEGEGRPAETYYEVRERFGDFALLACSPKTGRTHQIRVHLSHVGHPVAQDRLYRGRRKLELPKGAPAGSGTRSAGSGACRWSWRSARAEW